MALDSDQNKFRSTPEAKVVRYFFHLMRYVLGIVAPPPPSWSLGRERIKEIKEGEERRKWRTGRQGRELKGVRDEKGKTKLEREGGRFERRGKGGAKGEEG